MPIRVLLVDDEGPARRKMRRLLADAPDFEVVGEAVDGDAAIESIERLKPDAVFLDVQMPKHDGLEVAAALAPPLPEIFFVTAHDKFALKAFEVHALDYLLNHQDEDFLFVYFGTVDQGCHMLWHFMDPQHPGYVQDDVLKDGIAKLYEMLDSRLGRVRQAIGKDTTLIVMSDHGFAPFYWEVNLNTWLLEHGYIVLKDPSKQESGEFFSNVDWSRTRAYAAGLNGLYVNLKGREKNGAVASGAEYDAKQDLGRVAMTLGKTPALVEKFTITLTATGGNKGKLTMDWEHTSASVAFTVK